MEVFYTFPTPFLPWKLIQNPGVWVYKLEKQIEHLLIMHHQKNLKTLKGARTGLER